MGTRFKPEVYQTERNGIQTLGFTPDSFFVTLTGSGQWKNAYWEIADIKFNGVNQGPQAAARFTTQDSGAIQAKIAVASLRYGVIRPCGPLAGVNPLESCKPVSLSIQAAGTNIKLSWPAAAVGYQVQTTPTLVSPQWSVTNVTVEVVNDRNVATIPIGPGTQFFRVAK